VSAPHADEIIAGYISRLEAASSALPRARRDELVGDIQQHVAEARSAFEDETDADVLNLLDRLGDPADLVAAAGSDPAPLAAAPVTMPVGFMDVLAAVLLWFFWPVGVVLTWLTARFTLFDKLAITLAPVIVLVLIRIVLLLRFPGPHWLFAGIVLPIVLTPVVSTMYALVRLVTSARRAPAI
jgi:hypothetical protein